MKSISNFTLTVIFNIIFVSLFSSSAFALEQKIALFPFTINSEKNMSFLEKGIFEMLSTKLKAEKHTIVQIDEKNISDKDDILKIAKEKNADYAISGSLMIFGNTLNLSAFLYDIKSGNSIVVFNKSDNNKDNLFEHIDSFAGEVLAKMDVQVSPKPLVQTKTEPLETKTVAPQKKASESSNVLATSVFKSDAVEGVVDSLTTGDVNGDGIRDIVFINGYDIVVAKYMNGQFEIQKRIEGKHYLKSISVSVFDTNKNGIDEIFITSVHRTSKFVQSYVIEWNGTDYVETIQKSKWFFETQVLPGSPDVILAGQQQHFAEGIFSRGIYRLAYNKSENNFISADKINLPDHADIYSVTTGDAMNKGVQNIVSLNTSGYITVYDDHNNELWQSSDVYGGSLKYLEPRKSDTQRRLYFSPRVIVSDIDNDSLTEVVTINNHNSSPRVFVNLKNFTKGYITCLVWDKLNLDTKWETQTVSGYVSDFNISDIDSDGNNDLIYSVVEKVGKFWTKKQTYFVIQPVQ